MKDQLDELAFYTLQHPDQNYFIHQHIVDAFTAQASDETTKSIAITFSLVGLYLFVEKQYTGKQVQNAHIQLSKNKKQWPSFEIPNEKGTIFISQVLEEAAGKKRDEMIKKWCRGVWQAYHQSHETVAALVKRELGV